MVPSRELFSWVIGDLFLAGCFLSFALGSMYFFKRSVGIEGFTRTAGYLSSIAVGIDLSALIISHTTTNIVRLLASVALLVGAQALYWSAVNTTRRRPVGISFAMTAHDEVFVSEAYHYVRHPMYLAYIMTWVGAGLLANNDIAYIPIVVMPGLYVYAASREEYLFSKSRLGPSYERYKHLTGMFFPKLTSFLGATPKRKHRPEVEKISR